LREWGYKVNEELIDINDLFKYHEEECLQEIFGLGTAAVVSPIGKLKYKEKIIIINDNKFGPVT